MTDVELSRAFVRLLKGGQRVRSQAKGASMAPVIEPGDWLVVAPTAYTDLRVGDIAVFGLPAEQETLTTHRVVRRTAASFEARGDREGWTGPGESVPAECLYGRVVRIERAGQSWSLAGWRRFRDALRVRLSRAADLAQRAARSPHKIPAALRERVTRREADVPQTVAVASEAVSRPAFLVPDGQGGFWLIPIHHGVADMEQVYALNESGAEVWKWLGETDSAEALARRLQERFQISTEEARHDVEKLLLDLRQLNVLNP